MSKNNPGGLKHRKFSAKEVKQYANVGCPQRCFVRPFKCYVSHRPAGPIKDDIIYLTPIKNPKANVWYTSVPVGHNALSPTLRRLCIEAGIQGYITNHSLRVTAATRLFHKGVDEQLIMARTGHRSTDGIRAYKRISEEQQKALSDVLNNPEKEELKEVDCPSPPKKLRESPAVDCYSIDTATRSTGKENSLPIPDNIPAMNFSG